MHTYSTSEYIYALLVAQKAFLKDKAWYWWFYIAEMKIIVFKFHFSSISRAKQHFWDADLYLITNLCENNANGWYSGN